LDFGQTFYFALLEAIFLIQTGAVSLSWSSVIVVINVGGTLAALILFLFNAEFWEAPAHWIEYAVQASVTATNVFFVLG